MFATYYNLSDRSDGGVHVTSRNATTLQRNACSIFITSSVSQDSSQNGNTGFCGVCQHFVTSSVSQDSSQNRNTGFCGVCQHFVTSSVSQDSSQNGNTGFCGVCQSFEIKQGTREPVMSSTVPVNPFTARACTNFRAERCNEAPTNNIFSSPITK